MTKITINTQNDTNTPRTKNWLKCPKYAPRPQNYQNTLGVIKMNHQKKKKKKKKTLQSLNDKKTPQTIVLLLLSSGLNYEDV